MNWIAVTLALLAPQEASPVPELLKKIDGRDPAETFRAIDALADLGPDRRAEIEKGAASLPEFYRETLLAELKAPAPPPRITLEAGKRRLALQLLEWGRQSGIRINNGESDSLDGELDVAFDRIHALDAFAQLCTRGRLYTRQNPRDAGYTVSNRNYIGAVFGHRSAAVVLWNARTRRRVDFSGPKPWRVELNFETLLGAGIRTVSWDKIRLFEAVGNGGASLKLAEPNAPSFFLERDGRLIEPEDPKLMISLSKPDKVDRIERLRFAATGLVARKTRTVEFFGRGGRYESNKGIDIEAGDLHGHRGAKVLTFTIRSKDAALRKVLAAAFDADLVYKDVKGSSMLWSMRETEGGLIGQAYWDYDWRQLRPGPCTCAGGCGCSCFNFTDEEIEAAAPKGYPDRIRFHLPDGVEERTIFAEFRNIELD